MLLFWTIHLKARSVNKKALKSVRSNFIFPNLIFNGCAESALTHENGLRNPNLINIRIFP